MFKSFAKIALSGLLLYASTSYAGLVTNSTQLDNAINNGKEGDTIDIASGVYTLYKQLKPKKNMVIRGKGAGKTTLQAAPSWQPSIANLPKTESPGAYALLLDKVTGVKISNLKITGPKLHGAIYAHNADNLELSNLIIENFLWSGVRTYFMDGFKVHDNQFINAGGKIKFSGGALHMNFTNDSEFWNNKIIKTGNHPTFYGFKGRKGNNLRFHHNDVQVNFSFEFPFEKDSNIEIDHNRFTGVISIPRLDGGPQQPDGKFSYHIHHNWLQKSYALEWARNDAIINNNLFDFAKSDDGGNLISSFGNRDVDGDTVMYNNLIANPGRGLFWGRAAYNNFKFYNNHVKASNTTRKEGLFGLDEDTKFPTIIIKDNIFENTAKNPRPLMRNIASYKAVIENNTLINVGDTKSFNNPNTGKPRGPLEPLTFKVGVNSQYLINNWDVCDSAGENCGGDTPQPPVTPPVTPPVIPPVQPPVIPPAPPVTPPEPPVQQPPAQPPVTPPTSSDSVIDSVDYNGGITVLPHTANMAFNSGTLSFDITPTTVKERRMGIFSKDAKNYGQGGHLSVMLENNTLVARLQSTSKSYELKVPGIKANQKSAVRLSFGENGMKLYVNGQLKAKNTYTGGLQGNFEPVVIGALQWRSAAEVADIISNNFKGSLNNVVLTAGDTTVTPPAPEPQPEPTPTPAPGTTTGPFSYNGQVVTKPHTAAMNLTSGSISFSVKPESLNVRRMGLVSKDAKGYGQGGHFTIMTERSKLIIRLQSKSKSYVLTSNDLRVGKTSAVRLTFGSNGMKLYIDGTLKAKNSYTGGLQGNSEPLVIGAHQWGSSAGTADKIQDAFRGTITNVVLSGDVITPVPSNPQPTPAPTPTPQPETPVEEPTQTGKRVVLKAKVGLPNIPGHAQYTTVAKGNVGQWGDGVTVRGYDFNGKPSRVVYDTKFKNDDFGLGVISDGDRWPQIDFYTNKGNKSERLEIDFGTPVTNIELVTGMLGFNEGRAGKNEAPAHETGKWVAYNKNGQKIAEGLIGPGYSALGKDKKRPGSYGAYPIAVKTNAAVQKIVITATGFRHGTKQPHNRKYGENNSDLGIIEVSYDR